MLTIFIKALAAAGVLVAFIETTQVAAESTGEVIVEPHKLFKLLVKAVKIGSGRNEEVYSFAHIMLNLDSMPPAMWNNMGYWPIHSRHLNMIPSDFKSACANMANRLSLNANLCTADSLIDVGIGCGDQSLLYAPQVEKYIGITSLTSHSAIASRRLAFQQNAEILTLDASDPVNDWPPSILRRSLVEGQVNKILALDCLYHFTPTREKFLTYVNRTLECAFNKGATEVCFAAEDLVCDDKVSLKNNFLLAAFCLAANAPLQNIFTTKQQYLTLLQRCGFTREKGWSIAIEDISDCVFPGLASFLEYRANINCSSTLSSSTALTSPPAPQPFEINHFLRFERFAAFSKVIRWWADTGIVRSVMITVKKTRN
ncbi:hypothetical protein V1511DRAFT_520629 [Dipodascopsis uninucleata]